MWDIVAFCERNGILCQVLGSTNSAVCFTLGITNADAIALGLLFEQVPVTRATGRPISTSTSNRTGKKRSSSTSGILTTPTGPGRQRDHLPGEVVDPRHVTGARESTCGPWGCLVEGDRPVGPASPRSTPARGSLKPVPDVVLEMTNEVLHFPPVTS